MSTGKSETREFHHHRYETDKAFDGAFSVKGHGGIAWDVLGWEVEADEDTEWSGYYVRTGEILAVMVGDDRVWTFSPDDITPLAEEEYCGGCGQIGCGHGGR